MRHRTHALLALQPQVKYTALRVAGPAIGFVDRRDLEQDGWVALLKASRRYNGTVKFSTFVNQRLKGAMIDGLRRWAPRNRHTKAPCATWEELSPANETTRADEAPSPEAQHLGTELWKVVDQLPDREAHILKRFYQDDESQSVIALELGLSESRVSQLRQQALATLRSALAA